MRPTHIGYLAMEENIKTEALDLSESNNFKQPQKGDKLIKKPSDYNDLSVIGNGSRGYLKQTNIEEGYYRAAILLLDKAIKSSSIDDKDGLIYPALFSFRHHLELVIKNCIKNFSGKVINDKHSLSSLWGELNKSVPKYDANDDVCRAVDSIIEELHQIDTNSMSFRYAEDKQGKPTISNEKDIDLQNLKQVVKKMYNFFYGISSLSEEALTQ